MEFLRIGRLRGFKSFVCVVLATTVAWGAMQWLDL